MAKLKETHAGDWLAARDQPIHMPRIKLPAPVMAFAMEPKNKGDDDKVHTALRRLQEEDPTIDLHRDEQTGEQIVAGLSQIHVEVIVDRMKSRFGAEVTLKPPRVPYQETIRGSAKAHGRHKKQTGGRGQFGDCHIEIEPLADGEFEFVNAIKGGVIPHGFIPAVEKGVLEAMQQGAVAGYPVKGVRVRLFDGSYHTVDSSEMAFKLAGSIAMRQALEQAGAVLLEPIMLVTCSVPDDSVGDVMGDLSSRRGRPLGTEAVGGMTDVKAEVPMSEMLTYAPDLRVADRRPGRVHARVPALRGDPGAPGPEGGRQGARRGRGRRGVTSHARRRDDRRALVPGGERAKACVGGSGVATLALPVMARTRDIRTNQLDVACDVCGRTLLRGEHAEHFLAGGERRMVCDLCTARAQHEGWIRESGADDLEMRHPRHEGRGVHRPPALRPPRAPSRERAGELEPQEPWRRARGAARREPPPPPPPEPPRRELAHTSARCRPTPS